MQPGKNFPSFCQKLRDFLWNEFNANQIWTFWPGGSDETMRSLFFDPQTTARLCRAIQRLKKLQVSEVSSNTSEIYISILTIVRIFGYPVKLSDNRPENQIEVLIHRIPSPSCISFNLKPTHQSRRSCCVYLKITEQEIVSEEKWDVWKDNDAASPNNTRQLPCQTICLTFEPSILRATLSSKARMAKWFKNRKSSRLSLAFFEDREPLPVHFVQNWRYFSLPHT